MAQTGDNLAQEFEPLAGKIGDLGRQAGDVAARSRQAWYEAGADRIVRRREHDRDNRCHLLCCKHRPSHRYDHIDLESDELSGNLAEALGTSLRPTILDRQGATLDPAEFAQSLSKGGSPCTPGRRRARSKEPNDRHLRWCCARAASGHTAAPATSVMSSRRLMSDMGLPPALAPPSVFLTLNLPQRDRQVLAADLNCSESRRAACRLPCFRKDSTRHRGRRPAALRNFNPAFVRFGSIASHPTQPTALPNVRFAPKSGQIGRRLAKSALCQDRTHAVQQKAPPKGRGRT